MQAYAHYLNVKAKYDMNRKREVEQEKRASCLRKTHYANRRIKKKMATVLTVFRSGRPISHAILPKTKFETLPVNNSCNLYRNCNLYKNRCVCECEAGKSYFSNSKTCITAKDLMGKLLSNRAVHKNRRGWLLMRFL